MTDILWEIEGKRIGEKPYVIAEIGLNHNGDEALAAKMIEAAADCGADAVKFQIFSADKLVAPPPENAGFDEVAFFKQFELPFESYQRLFNLCQEKKITFLATPFDNEKVDFLQSMGVAAYKIASGDLTHLPLVRHIAAKGKPVLLSTGMATLEEVSNTIEIIRQTGNNNILLFHCTSAYPCPSEEVNLNNIITLQNEFDLPVGLSDHTEGNLAAIAAVTLGAVMIEKHFTLDRNLPGPDQKLSSDPAELKALVDDLNQLTIMRGRFEKGPTKSELSTKQAARRSIFAAVDINPGTVIEADMLTFLRPATGISPLEIDNVTGKKVTSPIKKGELLSREKIC